MSFSDIAARLRQHADDKEQQAAAPQNFGEMYILRARILGVLIRDARQAAGLSLEDCASQIGAAADTLNAWELGQQMPGLPQLELLAYTLSVPISHFFGTETMQHQKTEQRKVQPGEYTILRGRLIGALLRGAREQQNLLPEQLANEAGLTPAHITAYELGQRPIPVPILVTLAGACHVNMSYFLEDGNRVGDFLALQEDLKRFADLPEGMRRFVSSPVNQPYLELAMRLSQMSTSELRGIAEAILNITL
ncbi:MAG: transcriptional regulator [Anaerolineae bacterium]|nr:transcriptional regulator [Anaerolineae bacterium]